MIVCITIFVKEHHSLHPIYSGASIHLYILPLRMCKADTRSFFKNSIDVSVNCECEWLPSIKDDPSRGSLKTHRHQYKLYSTSFLELSQNQYKILHHLEGFSFHRFYNGKLQSFYSLFVLLTYIYVCRCVVNTTDDKL